MSNIKHMPGPPFFNNPKKVIIVFPDKNLKKKEKKPSVMI